MDDGEARQDKGRGRADELDSDYAGASHGPEMHEPTAQAHLTKGLCESQNTE